MKKVEIIFDFDHTLFSARKLYKAFRLAFRKLGVNEKLFQETFQKSKGEGRDYNPERQFKLICKKEPEIKIKDLRKAFLDVLEDAPKFFYNDVSDFLKKWQKQADLILLSYGEEKFQEQKIEASKIKKYFKKIIITRDIEKSRPFRKIFAKNKKIIFVEDNPQALSKTKSTFPGIITVRINRGEGKYAKEKNASNIDFKVKNLIELEKIIKKEYMDVFKINPRKIDLKTMGKISEFIKKGGVIVCPTDTVYGLICDANNKEAVEKIFKIKKRPKGKPISIFVKDIKMAKKFAKINKKQEEFLEKVWPGAVTLVLKPRKNLPKNIFQGKNTIGVRIPNYKLILNLIDKIKHPLAESSANISGKPASTKIKDVLNQFKKEKNYPDLIIDAGNLKASSPSAVIDLTGKKPKILRKS